MRPPAAAGPPTAPAAGRGIAYLVNPRRGGPDQVGVDFACPSEIDAAAVQRALARRFGRVSRVMQSYRPPWTHFVFVTGTEAAVCAAWPEIEGDLARAAPELGAARADHAARAQGDEQAWRQAFRRAVKRVHQEATAPVAAPTPVSLAWLEERIAAGASAEVEDALLRQAERGGDVLRAQITLHARSGRPERVVALAEARRDEVLALPVSGQLAEQLVGAYVAFGRETGSDDALASARRLARAFLPELERLGQADGVRRLLRAFAPAPADARDLPLSEELDRLAEAEPAERVVVLRTIRETHPDAPGVPLALASSLTAAGEPDRAIEALEAIEALGAEAERDRLAGAIEALLAEDRAAEALDRLGGGELSPHLRGLRGLALERLGRAAEAGPELEAAWEGGDRDERVALLVARRRWAGEAAEEAAAPYALVAERRPETLAAGDALAVALLAEFGAFGHLPGETLLGYHERFAAAAGRAEVASDDGLAALAQRLHWAERFGDAGRLLAAHQDLFEALLLRGDGERLAVAVEAAADHARRRLLAREAHFGLLEGLEPYVAALPDLGPRLVRDYRDIAVAEVAETLRHDRPLPGWMGDLRRALHFLDRAAGDDLDVYVAAERAALAARDQPVPPEAEPEAPLDLAGWRLALVGGHPDVRREVEGALARDHGLTDCVAIGSSREGHVDAAGVADRIDDRDLVAVITGYMGHDLSTIVGNLERAGRLRGRVVPVRSRGKSGVLREVLAAARAGAAA